MGKQKKVNFLIEIFFLLYNCQCFCFADRLFCDMAGHPLVDVYVDGACINNGKAWPDSAAGLGVWFGPYHKLNFNWHVISYDCNGELLMTNQIAEIQAADQAIHIALREGIKGLRIHTDSKYVLHGITKNWIAIWKENGWLNSKGKPVANKGEWITLACQIDRYEKSGCTLEWKYVKAHSGNIGNERADILAKWAAEANYDFGQFMTAPKGREKGCGRCGCPGPDASDSERQRYEELMTKMLESRKKTSLQCIHHDGKSIILP